MYADCAIINRVGANPCPFKTLQPHQPVVRGHVQDLIQTYGVCGFYSKTLFVTFTCQSQDLKWPVVLAMCNT